MMNDEMIRRQLRLAADECFSGIERMPSQKKAVMDRVKGATKRRAAYIRPAMVLAMVCMLALAGTAVAVGLGLFGSLREGLEDEMSYNRLALLEEASLTIGQTTAIGNYGELTVDQVYCDGSRLYYSYTIRKNDALASLYMGDGAKLTDGTELPPVDSWIEGIDDFMTAAFYEVALPEDFAPGESVTVVLTAIAHKDDGTLDLIDVPVDIPVTAPRKTLAGEGTLGGYPAKIELRVTDVDVYGTLQIAAPEDFEADGYYALAADGAEYPNLDWGADYENGTHSMKLRFDLPESMDGAKLVTGEEAIELK